MTTMTLDRLNTHRRPACRSGHRTARPGFSLLELLLVLVILGLLAGVAAFNLVGAGEKARVRTTEQSMDTIKGAIDSFQIEKGRVPNTLEELFGSGLLDATKSRTDAWSRAFYYSPEASIEGQNFRLISYGKDGQLGTPDDIDVWTMHKDDAPATGTGSGPSGG